jgi:hypothetical protein
VRKAPGEAEKLDWGRMNLADRCVVIDAAITKVRTRRSAPIHGAGVAWLELTPPDQRTGKVFPLCYSTLRRYRRKLSKALGLEWSQDVLRHTAASALCAVYEDLGRIARWLGNSPRMLQIHYLSVLTRREGEEILNNAP